MGRKRQSIIGFSQTIKMSWMDFTADQVIRNVPPGDIHLALDELLREELSVNRSAKRGDRQKAISILLRIWARPGRSMKGFRDDGLRLFSEMPTVLSGPAEVSWLLEALLHSSESGSGLMQSLLSSPVMFPFKLDFQNGKPPKMSDRVEITPHGWDDFILRLKN